MRVKISELHELAANLNKIDRQGLWYVLCTTRENLPYHVWARDVWDEHHLQRLQFSECALGDRDIERLKNSPINRLVRGDYTWKCDHPLAPGGICVYDDEFDSAHDNCVYCGQPNERK